MNKKVSNLKHIGENVADIRMKNNHIFETFIY